MPEITLTIDVPSFTEEELRSAIIKAAVDEVFRTTIVEVYDEDGDLFDRRKKQPVLESLRAQTSKAVEESIQRVVDEEVPAVVRDVLTQEFQPFNRWGERRGERTTIRAMIGEHAEKWLEAMVDPRSGREDRHSSNRVARLHWIIRTEVEAVFASELRDVSKKAASEAAAQIKARVGEEISAVVVKALGVR